jgi:hypothetical protein
MSDIYGEPHGTYSKSPSIDSEGGEQYQRVHPDVAKALRARFDGGSASVWHPIKPGVILHDIENFWDGPSEVAYLGDGELAYTSPYSGDTDHFNLTGYYDRDGNFTTRER